MNVQPIINLGTLGSVSDGKSTLIEKLTGIKTQRHSSEKKRNITIKPGYANLKIWECPDCNEIYPSGSINNYECKLCNIECQLIHHLSFIDCPGHSELILTMMGSVSLMSGCIVVVSAAEPIIKKPQLIQHLLAAKMANMDKLIICFNKLDLINKELAIQRKNELDELLEKLDIKPFIIIPCAFNKKLGIDNLLYSLVELFPPNKIITPPEESSFFRITRSFDINKSNILWSDVQGGVVGGSLIKGIINIGDQVEIRPGIIGSNKQHQPIITTVISLETDNNIINTINPGGLVAIGTDIDPYYTKNDMLAGNILGKLGTLPDVYTEINLNYTELNEFEGSWDQTNGDTVFLQIGNVSSEARLTKKKKLVLTFLLLKPACIEKNTKILICRKIDGILTIVGYGIN